MRRKAATDRNHSEVMNGLRQRGCTVHSTHQLGQGFPDIVVGYSGRTYLFEIKDPEKIPSQRRLTEDEKEWFARWRGHVSVVHTAEEAWKEIEHERSYAERLTQNLRRK